MTYAYPSSCHAYHYTNYSHSYAVMLSLYQLLTFICIPYSFILGAALLSGVCWGGRVMELGAFPSVPVSAGYNWVWECV